MLASAFIVSTLLAGEPATTVAPSDLPDAAVLKALCPAKKSCTVLDKLAGGRDTNGNDVVFAGVQEKARGKPRPAEDGEGEEPCLPAPYALLHLKAGRVLAVEPIVTLRADDCSYGVRGGGESITFDGKTATYTIEGGSNWAWNESTTWEIKPRLREIQRERNDWWTVSSNSFTSTTDARKGRTTVVWHIPDCGANGEPPDEGEAPNTAPKYGYIEIPRLDSIAAFDWKAAAFPKQGLAITSQKDDGFITFGKPGTSRDARFRVIALSSRDLLVEVADPEISDQAKNWVNDDHLEIWAGPELPGYGTHCFEREAGDDSVAQQWGIRTSDGQIFRGMGRPTSDPTVERVELESADWGHVYRFRIAFTQDLASVTVVYSDSERGKRQRRLLATSRVRLRDPLSLGVLTGAAKKR